MRGRIVVATISFGVLSLAAGLKIGPYEVEWGEVERDGLQLQYVAVGRGGEELLRFEDAWVRIDPLSGRDITGEGNPDLVVFSYWGGAHCCIQARVVDLGPVPRVIPAGAPSNCGGDFQDLDGDGVFEYFTCDDTFVYLFCPYATSPVSPAILRYEPGEGYVPAGYLFPGYFEQAIAQGREIAREHGPGEMAEWDGTEKCSALLAILPLLHAGRITEACQALREYYSGADREAFWGEILDDLAGDPYFPDPLVLRLRELPQGCPGARPGVKMRCNFINGGDPDAHFDSFAPFGDRPRGGGG